MLDRSYYHWTMIKMYLSSSETDILQLQQGDVTDLGRLISNRRLRSFYFIKLYIKS
jgi:hypothetical protein